MISPVTLILFGAADQQHRCRKRADHHPKTSSHLPILSFLPIATKTICMARAHEVTLTLIKVYLYAWVPSDGR
jgi:hypothetical protein